MNKVAIIMGSDSDLPVMADAAKVLEDFGIPFEITIVSAHRTPERMFDYARAAKQNGFGVIIAGAGGAAHLPGMVASLSALPVIGVPIKTKDLSGVDSLYSIVQMPRGVAVATVGINNATNAGLLAAQIIGSHDDGIYEKILGYKSDLKESVSEKIKKLDENGYKNYITNMK